MRRIFDAFAEFERARIASRTKLALDQKRQRGERCGGVPYGFVADGDGRLQVNPAEQGTLERIERMVTGGLGAYQIAKNLNRAGVVSRAGGQWRVSTIEGIVKRILNRNRDENVQGS